MSKGGRLQQGRWSTAVLLLLQVLVLLLPLAEARIGTRRIDQIRLSGGQGTHEGNVEVKIDGVWGYVCDDNFGFDEADTVCRDLGYDMAKTFTRNNNFGNNSAAWRRSSVKFWLSNVNCSSATSLANCRWARSGQHLCGATEIAGVSCWLPEERCEEKLFPCSTGDACLLRDLVCNNVTDCDDGSDEVETLCQDVGVTRLAHNLATFNIPGAALGVVYVKHLGEWGTICDDDFDNEDAKVICRSLGYEAGWSLAFSRAYLGIGSVDSKVWVGSAGCRGDEDWIGQCPLVDFGNNSCVHIEDSSVFCYDEGLQVRLSGLEEQGVGPVELRLGGEWGSVCDSRFDDFDAQVVCRMLGYHGDDSQAYKQAGRVVGPVWQMQLDCLGHEDDLQQCRLRFSNDTCTTTAGVICSCTSGRLDAALHSLLPEQCGKAKDASTQFLTRLAKIRFGEHPSRFEYPWLVSFRRVNIGLGPASKLHCGGTIISEFYVVTAAHCFQKLGALNLVVRVGDYNTDYLEESEEDYFIDKIWKHEEFGINSFNDNDIALVKVEAKNGRGIRFGPQVMPLCLPRVGERYNNLQNCSIVGWGRTTPSGQDSNRPFEGKVLIRPDHDCEEAYVKGTNNFTSSFVCAGSELGNVNSCLGDSGGPLVCRPAGQTRKALYGIVSYGNSCQPYLAPDSLTRVTKYLRWIYGKIYGSG